MYLILVLPSNLGQLLIMSAYHLNWIFGSFFWTNGTALFRTKETERIEPYHLMGSFGCRWAGVWVRSNKKHGGWTSRHVRCFSGRLGKYFVWRRRQRFHRFVLKNLNRILGYFEQTIATYSLDEFKAHFRSQRTTCEIVVREVTATGNIPAGNPFGRHVIDQLRQRKQILIYLWCMANQESARVVADRFNIYI